MIGDVIVSIRKKRKLTQGKLAEKAGVTRSYLSKIENNQYMPSMRMTTKIANVLDVPVPVIFFFTLKEEDIKPEKRKVYKVLAPSIKDLLLKIIDEDFDIKQ